MSVVTTFCTFVTSIVGNVFGDTTPRVQNSRTSTQMSIANHLVLICTPLHNVHFVKYDGPVVKG